MNNLINKINQHKKIILWSELGTLLHDIGKMSGVFIEYRQGWRKHKQSPRSPKTGWNWWNDPHDHEFITNPQYDNQIQSFPDILKVLKDSCPDAGIFEDYFTNEGKHTLLKAIDTHTEPLEKFYEFLKAADGKDSAIDRNNPLFTAEQEEGDVYDTDVYGKEDESNRVEIDSIDEDRGKLYGELNSLLPDYIDKIKKGSLLYEDYGHSYDNKSINNLIRKYFDQKVFADTTRPQNDTSLWEHNYAVVCIQKALLVHKIIYGEDLNDFSKVRFGIFGVGWDGLAFVSSGHKIGDVMARKKQIDEYKSKIRKIFEFDYLLGNKIYDDDNGIYFLIPALTHREIEHADFDAYKEYGQLLQDIQKVIGNLKTGENISFDLFPHFHFIEDTQYITNLVECITELDKKSRYHYTSDLYGKEYFEDIKKKWDGVTDKTVCPICRQRPVEVEKGNVNENKKICKTCKERRVKINVTLEKQETPFISEIIKANKANGSNKAALIVVKFGLKEWLNGRMVRSLFITQAKGLERELEDLDLGNTKDFAKDEKEARDWLEAHNLISSGYDYQRIKKEIELCFNYEDKNDNERKYAQSIVFLYDRRVKKDKFNRWPEGLKKQWDHFIDSAIKEHKLRGNIDGILENIVCAKTPTPSTILDVWNTTQKFTYSLVNYDKNANKLKGILIKSDDNENGIFEPKTRLKFQTPEIEPEKEGINKGEICKAEIDGKKIEIVWIRDKEWLIIGEDNKNDFEKKTAHIQETEFGKKEIKPIEIQGVTEDKYYPFRIITQSPDLFMMIVPADKALAVSQKIYEEYNKHFGKVMGRLPLSIGNIFFKEHTPMFVALDSARRMVDNFEKLNQKPAEMKVSRKQDENTIPCIKRYRITFSQVNGENKNITWEIPHRLGDGKIDYYHPYFRVKPESKDYSRRKNYFKTIAGDLIHITEVEPDDVLEVYPNYYDFEFLDSNARRFDINIDNDLKRKSNVADFKSKPFLLDELKQKIMFLWVNFLTQFEEMTDTKLRNLQSLWLTKYQEWKVDMSNKSSTEYKIWMDLVISSIQKEFKKLTDEQYLLLRETIENGLFFDTLELYLGILKERIE